MTYLILFGFAIVLLMLVAIAWGELAENRRLARELRNAAKIKIFDDLLPTAHEPWRVELWSIKVPDKPVIVRHGYGRDSRDDAIDHLVFVARRNGCALPAVEWSSYGRC